MKTAELANRIFDRSVERYHISDDINLPCPNPFEKGSIEAIFFEKNWVDAVQWHLEDIIRDPEIDPVDALALKRRIDKSNQVRTDMVEEIDSWFRDKFRNVVPAPDASINTESPAWALDRLSILALKIWHMREQLNALMPTLSISRSARGNSRSFSNRETTSHLQSTN